MEIELEDELTDAVTASAATGLETMVERLAATVGALESAVERLCGRSAFAMSPEDGVRRIVATVETGREAELEVKLAAEEAELRNQVLVPRFVTNGRKTLPVATVSMLAKQGLALESLEAGALDAALVSLSLEQRIAVKSELMRAGLLG